MQVEQGLEERTILLVDVRLELFLEVDEEVDKFGSVGVLLHVNYNV